MHGYDRFEATLPTGPSGGLTAQQRRTRFLTSVLTGAGLTQAINLPFVNPDDLRTLGQPHGSELLTVKNPLREEESKLRPSLLPGLVNSIRYNLSHGTASVALFELGKVFTSEPDPADPRLPIQFDAVGWAIIGEVGIQVLHGKGVESDGRVSIGIWKLLAEALDLDDTEARPSSPPGWHPGRTAEVVLAGEPIGHVGELSPRVARAFEIPGRVAIAELRLAPLVAPVPPPQSKSPSVFPPVDFDLSFVVPDEVPVAHVVSATEDEAGDLLERSQVFDEFRGSGLESGSRAVAIRYRLRASDRTLTNEEVAPTRDAMITAAERLGARLRGT